MLIFEQCHNGLLSAASEDILKELKIDDHLYAEDTVLSSVFGYTLSQCMFNDFVVSFQCWFSNAKLKLNTCKSEYMIIRKHKVVKRVCKMMVTSPNIRNLQVVDLICT